MGEFIFQEKKKKNQRAQRSKQKSISLEISISIEMFNLARNFQSRRLDLPTKIGPRWVARSKFSFLLEIFNLARNLEFFKSLGPLGRARKHKLFALVNVQMPLGQTAGCPRVSQAKKLMCSPRNREEKNFSLWSTGGFVPRLSRLSKSLRVQSLCAFFLP